MAITDEMRGVLNLIAFLKKRPGSRPAEIARALHCSEKAVEQYLARILMCGVPPYFPHDYIGVHRDGERISLTFTSHFKRPLRLNLVESLSLTATLQHIVREGSLPHQEAARSLLDKLRAQLTLGDQESLAGLSRRVAIQEGPGGVRARLEELEDAIRKSREVDVEYYSTSSRRLGWRKVRPYSVFYQDGNWYALAHDVEKRRVGSFRVDRMKTVRLLDETFSVPSGFKPEEHRPRDHFEPLKRRVRAEVRFAPETARWVREETPEKNVREEPDGSIVVTIYAETEEFILSEVLQYGDEAEIVKPPSLRRAMARLLDRQLGIYGEE